jgi:hypothetical protein
MRALKGRNKMPANGLLRPFSTFFADTRMPNYAPITTLKLKTEN